jgi:hypothetical protein
MSVGGPPAAGSGFLSQMKEKEKYLEEFDFPFCDEVGKYEKVAKIGQGTFGLVQNIIKIIYWLNNFIKMSF